MLKRDKKQRGLDWDEYLQTIAGETPDDLSERVRELEHRVENIESKMRRR